MHLKSHYNKHLTYTDRLKIEALYRQKLPKKQIAAAIGTSYPTICREVKRGKCTLIDYELRPYESYSADVAQDDYKKKKHPQRQAARSVYRSIEQRDISRDDFGHWEMDTVIGKVKGKSSCALVLTERKTRQEITLKLPTKTATNTVQAINSIARKLGSIFPTLFKTITMDNGSEFADAVGIEYHKGQQRTTIFYCHPYSSYERGSNENANKLIRRHIPKGQSMTKISKNKIKAVQNWINHYPRPMFKGKTSNDIFYQCIKEEGIPITPALLDLFPIYENYLEEISLLT